LFVIVLGLGDIGVRAGIAQKTRYIAYS
jgi:hypothetical protein